MNHLNRLRCPSARTSSCHSNAQSVVNVCRVHWAAVVHVSVIVNVIIVNLTITPHHSKCYLLNLSHHTQAWRFLLLLKCYYDSHVEWQCSRSIRMAEIRTMCRSHIHIVHDRRHGYDLHHQTKSDNGHGSKLTMHSRKVEFVDVYSAYEITNTIILTVTFTIIVAIMTNVNFVVVVFGIIL